MSWFVIHEVESGKEKAARWGCLQFVFIERGYSIATGDDKCVQNFSLKCSN